MCRTRVREALSRRLARDVMPSCDSAKSPGKSRAPTSPSPGRAPPARRESARAKPRASCVA
eukprot:7393664-Alexandrium_andersonii.AAC.1